MGMLSCLYSQVALVALLVAAAVAAPAPDKLPPTYSYQAPEVTWSCV